jgi:chromate transporter
MISTLLTLALVFAELSLLAFGGGNSILPEMHRQAVDVQHWMSAREFDNLFAIAQAAPGPNLMIAPLIGWKVAGLAGVIVVSLALFGPSSVLAGLVAHALGHYKDVRALGAIKKGMAPITTGLVAASAWLIAKAAIGSVETAAIAAFVALAASTTKAHPLWYLAAGALAGVAFPWT